MLLWKTISLKCSSEVFFCFFLTIKPDTKHVWQNNFEAPVAFQWSLNTSCHIGHLLPTLLNSYLGMDFNRSTLYGLHWFSGVLYCVVNKHGRVFKLLPCSVCSIVGRRAAHSENKSHFAQVGKWMRKGERNFSNTDSLSHQRKFTGNF